MELNNYKCPVDINQLAQQVHANAQQHGFWENYTSTEHHLCLAVCELAEAVEADRKGRKANNKITLEFEMRINEQPSKHEAATCSEIYACWFEHFIKDTVGDELADAVLRLLDLAAAKDVNIRAFEDNIYIESILPSTCTFTENVWHLMGVLTCVGSSTYYAINKALRSIADLANQWEIDLWWHVLAKMQYNTGRTYKHGKQY